MCHTPLLTDRSERQSRRTNVSIQAVSHFYSRGGLTERGASLVEYSLLLAMIALVCFGAVTYLGQALPGSMSTVGASVAA